MFSPGMTREEKIQHTGSKLRIIRIYQFVVYHCLRRIFGQIINEALFFRRTVALSNGEFPHSIPRQATSLN